jgi:hypothetical protein
MAQTVYSGAAEKIRDNLHDHRKELDALRTEVDALKKGDLTQRFTKLEKSMEKFQKYVSILEPLLSRFGTYTYDNGVNKAFCIITAAFPRAGTMDAVVFESAGSGGIDTVYGKHLGTGAQQIQPLLELDDEEDDEGGSSDGAEEVTGAIMAA